MSYCLSPNCQKPHNADNARFCINCGTKLLLGDRYRSLKPIGQGGFGRTFLAIDEYKPSKPRCVIKQFYPQAQGTNSEDKAAALFAQEAVRLDELGKHPQVPELLAYFTQDGRQYLVQEFIDGQNLAQELEEEGASDESQIRQILNDLLPVLEFIHKHQVIHRDIKPENIIRRTGSQLVLVDFGAAKIATGTALANTGTVIGSAAYVAPEQSIGKATFASDIYSLGVTCIHLLTGINPFDLYSVSEGAWVWQDYLSNPVSGSLNQILTKMLEDGIKRRYQSATEILQDLNAQTLAQTVVPANVSSESEVQVGTWRCVNTLTGHTGLWAGVRAIAMTPNGKILASASDDYTIKLWDLNSGKEIRTLFGHSHFVRDVAFTPNGESLISSSDDMTIRQWDWETGEQIFTFSGHTKPVSAIAVSPDGQTLASGSDDYTIKLWELKTKREIRTLFGHSNYVQSLAFSPDNQILASGSCDNTAKLWNLSTREEMAAFSVDNWVLAVTFTPDGSNLITATFDNLIKVWNISTGQQRRTLFAHTGWMSGIESIALSPNGKILASAGAGDKLIKLWNLDQGELLCTFTGHLRGVTSVLFNPDGKMLVSGSHDKTIKIWRCN